MIYLTLIYEFFKIGLFAIGGGLATLPFLTDLADKYPWLTSEMLSEMVAVSEATPGPLGVNMATYAGYMAGIGEFGNGTLGQVLAITTALTATTALVAPSFIVILIVSRMLDKYRSSVLVESAFSGLRPAVAGLIAAAAWSVIKVTLFDFAAWQGFASLLDVVHLPELLLFAVLLIVTNIKRLKKLHPLYIIGSSAAIGICMGYMLNW